MAFSVESCCRCMDAGLPKGDGLRHAMRSANSVLGAV